MAAVPLGFFLFLAELAAGGLLVTAALDWAGDVSGGYLLLNAIFLVAAGGAGVWLRAVLPATRLLAYPPGQPWVALEPAIWGGAMAIGVIQVLLLRLGRRRGSRAAGLLCGASCLAALSVSAAAYRPPAVSVAPMLISLLGASLALGTVWSGMMLGHWYLVTPRLSPRPLLRLTGALALALLIQLAYTALAGLSGAGEAGGIWLLLFSLRTGVGILFPLALSWLIWRTARVRSMMSATGLLYIALGCVLAGEIIAKSLFFLSSRPL